MTEYKSDYKDYQGDTLVKIIETGEIGSPFESFMGFISVFFEEEDGPGKCKYFKMDEVEFINKLNR